MIERVRARTRRTRLVAAGLVVLLTAAGLLAWRWWSRPPGDVLLASGTIETTEVAVSFKIPGRVVERPVEGRGRGPGRRGPWTWPA